jgi:hypothetical protein
MTTRRVRDARDVNGALALAGLIGTEPLVVELPRRSGNTDVLEVCAA